MIFSSICLNILMFLCVWLWFMFRLRAIWFRIRNRSRNRISHPSPSLIPVMEPIPIMVPTPMLEPIPMPEPAPWWNRRRSWLFRSVSNSDSDSTKNWNHNTRNGLGRRRTCLLRNSLQLAMMIIEIRPFSARDEIDGRYDRTHGVLES